MTIDHGINLSQDNFVYDRCNRHYDLKILIYFQVKLLQILLIRYYMDHYLTECWLYDV